MTRVYITIDTEYSAGMAVRTGGAGRGENFARSISCETDAGAVGIGYQMDVFDRHGLKGVFFVDPMPALLWGVEAIADVVEPIVGRGHDVQLHCHTEWLALAGADTPLAGMEGRNIKDFTFEEQCRILEYARDTLVAAGAPVPVAFRAGNYGANDDTLRALAELGIAYDSSHCPGISQSDCEISLGPRNIAPLRHEGVIEVPTGCIAARAGGRRHMQLTAVSAAELARAVRHAVRNDTPSLTLVSHSFELLSRDRQKVNRIVKARFERFCADLAAIKGATTGTYANNPPQVSPVAPILPHSFARTGWRMAEQAVANALYGAG
jgi:hypothetical protein